jgi:YHS domain-containing protein
MAAPPGTATRLLLLLPTGFFLVAAFTASGLSLFRARPRDPTRRLYQTPGGLYTLADIRTNGTVEPAEKFSGIPANHHLHAAVGDPICPITHARANPRFAWTIGGRRYLFCCPPCIDDFVRLARSAPGAIRPPEAYVAR